MKFRTCRGIFRLAMSAVAVLTLAWSGTGCMSSSLEDAAPQSALTQASGPRVSGQYPDLNIAPQVAAEQISEEERQALVEGLAAARSRGDAVAPSANAEAEAQRLRRLAQSHADAKLKEIERGN